MGSSCSVPPPCAFRIPPNHVMKDLGACGRKVILTGYQERLPVGLVLGQRGRALGCWLSRGWGGCSSGGKNLCKGPVIGEELSGYSWSRG